MRWCAAVVCTRVPLTAQRSRALAGLSRVRFPHRQARAALRDALPRSIPNPLFCSNPRFHTDLAQLVGCGLSQRCGCLRCVCVGAGSMLSAMMAGMTSGMHSSKSRSLHFQHALLFAPFRVQCFWPSFLTACTSSGFLTLYATLLEADEGDFVVDPDNTVLVNTAFDELVLCSRPNPFSSNNNRQNRTSRFPHPVHG